MIVSCEITRAVLNPLLSSPPPLPKWVLIKKKKASSLEYGKEGEMKKVREEKRLQRGLTS